MTGSRNWDDILDSDETILWQGRPDPSFVFSAESVVMALFGLAFAGFALFWMVMASRAGGFFWMFGLIHFSVGASITAGAFLKKPLQRRRTWYSLSNKRAFIATDFPLIGKRLKSYTIDAGTVLTMEEGPRATIRFATTTYTHKGRTRTRRIGFQALTDGSHVYRLMRQIQQADRDRAALTQGQTT